MENRFLTLVSAAIIAVAITGCGHQHTFSEATCTSPKTCTECGETEGEPLGHTWVEATCTEPKTCTVCGLTEGAPIGHTKEIGRCANCGELANEELCLSLKQAMDNLSSSGNSAIDATDVDFTSLQVAYSASVISQLHLDNASKYCDEVIDICADYDELKEVKTSTEKLKKAIPSKITGTDQNTIVKWYEKFAEFCKASSDLYHNFAEFASTLKEQ
jgi:hypothetical protein